MKGLFLVFTQPVNFAEQQADHRKVLLQRRLVALADAQQIGVQAGGRRVLGLRSQKLGLLLEDTLEDRCL